MTTSVADVWQQRSTLALLVRRDLSVKYQQSFLGYLWSMIEPLTVAATYWFIFGVLYNQRVADDVDYLLFLTSGMFAWMWVSGVLGEAPTALTSQARLITTIRTPREIFALGRVAGKFFEYLAAVPVIVVVALAGGTALGPSMLYLPAAIVVEGVLLIGVALALASLNVMLKDTEKFMRLLQRVLFYAIPVIYPLSKVTGSGMPHWLKVVYQLNPLVGIVELHHAAWTSRPPATLPVVAAIIGSLLALVGGWWLFRRLEPAVLKEL